MSLYNETILLTAIFWHIFGISIVRKTMKHSPVWESHMQFPAVWQPTASAIKQMTWCFLTILVVLWIFLVRTIMCESITNSIGVSKNMLLLLTNFFKDLKPDYFYSKMTPDLLFFRICYCYMIMLWSFHLGYIKVTQQ